MNGQEKFTWLIHGMSFTGIHLPPLNTAWPSAEFVGGILIPMKLMDILGPEVLGGAGAKVEVLILQIITFYSFLPPYIH